MNLRLANMLILCLCAVCLLPAGVTGQNVNDNAVTDTPQTVIAKREIIRLLLGDIFRGEKKETLILSTRNIPKEILDDFPRFDKLTASLISQPAENDNICAFEFSIFEITGDNAFVLFGDCRDGLGYSFRKFAGKWEFSPLEIEK